MSGVIPFFRHTWIPRVLFQPSPTNQSYRCGLRKLCMHLLLESTSKEINAAGLQGFLFMILVSIGQRSNITKKLNIKSENVSLQRNIIYTYKPFRATDSHLEYSKKIVRSSDTLRISKSLAVRIFPPSQNHSYLEYFFEKCKKPFVFNHNWGKTLALRILKKNILILT